MNIKIIPISLKCLLIIEPNVFEDKRGYFLEMHHQERFQSAGIDVGFVQDNLSFSKKRHFKGFTLPDQPSPGQTGSGPYWKNFIDLYQPTCVINAAAYTQVDKAENEETLAFAVNKTGCTNLT